MKAIVLDQAGGAELLRHADIPAPVPAAGELLIRVQALSINPVDIKTRKGGAFLSQLQAAPPVILGWDVSGIVAAVGEGVTRFRTGDAVFGMINFPGAGRAYAEYVTAPETHLALKPENIGHAEAAATTLAALTALQVLREGGIAAGQKVLVHAAAGGVGHFAVQLAKHFGATVVATASASNHEYLRGIGADEVVDYQNQDFRDSATDIDIVLDPLGGDTTLRSLDVLRAGGIVVSIVGGAKEPVVQAAEAKGVRARNYLVHSSGEDMAFLAGLLAEGKLRATVDHRFSFDAIAAAHAQVETGHTRGKVVVVIEG